ncbi:MAG: MBL fold metallo-hydrolase [Clostridia bacterium]|nr:MBL fold metallo-hydrolase [Clostridia bacterium]
MKVKVLTDNIAKNDLKGEWGLSVYAEYEGKKFLLDTGAGKHFAENAEHMDVDLADIDFGILSHAHYDHSDGMGKFFDINSKARFFLRKECAENCYGRKLIFNKYIGIHKGYLESYRDRLVFVSNDTELIPGVFLVGHKTPDLHLIGKKAGMYRKNNGKWCIDDFSHEQSLVFDTDKGLVIFNSCSHGGVDNIINEVSATFPDKHIYAVFGGFHLYNSSQEDVMTLAERIENTGIEKVYTGHCTGDKAFKLLKARLGEKAEQIYAGMELEF